MTEETSLFDLEDTPSSLPPSDELRKQPSDTTRLDSSITNGTENNGPFVRQVGNRTEKVKYSFVKAVVCGGFLEFHEAQLPFMFNRLAVSNIATNNTDVKKNKKRNVKRSKDTIRRLVLGNFLHETKLITLTFNNENDFDISDISVCNKKFSAFMHMLRKLYSNFKYIAVLELQKREAVHYHILCDLPYIDKKKISKMWGLGFIDIRRTSVAYEALFYILKYFYKSIDDKRFRNKRIYFCSKNLERPRSYYNEKAYELRRRMADENRSPTFSYPMDSPENGRIFVEEYNLSQTKPRTVTRNESDS